MDPKKRLTAMLAGLVGIAVVVAVLYGMNDGDVHATPPDVLDKFELAADRPMLPNLEFQDASGARKTLADFRGQVVLLNLWATWCTPCVAELPDLANAQEALKGTRVTVLPIDLEKHDLAKIAAFLKEKGAGTLPVYVDRTSAVMRDLEAFGLPLTVLIDAEGREIGRSFGAQPWDHPDTIAYLRHLAS